MHSWNDDWPHWDELYDALAYFDKLYFKCTGISPLTKEKYGTIRYSWPGLWIKKEEHVRIFREAIMRTVRKFPNVAGEICDDAGHTLTDEFFNGWCAGVTFKANGSYWSSKERPRGV